MRGSIQAAIAHKNLLEFKWAIFIKVRLGDLIIVVLSEHMVGELIRDKTHMFGKSDVKGRKIIFNIKKPKMEGEVSGK